MKRRFWISMMIIFLAGLLSVGAAFSYPETTYGSSDIPTPVQKIRKDLIQNYCDATWFYKKGMILTCPGKSDSTAGKTNGFVIRLKESKLENGSSTKPILWVHPQNKTGGKISGKYPAVKIKNGDHFKAKVGCMGGYSKCNLTFRLNYKIGNQPVRSLGSWKEVAGGGITTIDVNLSHLAGKEVRLILRTDCNKNPEAAYGFWMEPRITNNK